jgi:hypothetical protein
MEDTAMRIIAIALIVLGALGFVYQGFTLWTKETVAKVGPIKVEADQPHTVWIPPVIAGAAVIAGAVLLALAFRD